MKKLITVAKYTFIEVYRSKVMLSLLFMAIGLVLVSYVASEFAYGAPAKVALDFGFGMMSLSNLGMSIFIGSTLLSKEIENRTLYMILSRPLSRINFMLGKVIGLSSVLVINTFTLTFVTLFIFKILEGKIDSVMFLASWFSLVEALILMLFSVLFSLTTSSSLAVIYTIIVWIVGHAYASTSKLLLLKVTPALAFILKFFKVVIPDLEKLNFKDFLLYQKEVPFEIVLKTQAYGLLYGAFVLILISYLFKNKNLD